MALLPLAVLALLQGITEFLPISSSAHLIVGRDLLIAGGWHVALSPNQELALDVAVHVGTLAAVLVYLRRDVGAVLGGGVDLVARRRSARARLAVNIVVASVPIGIVGFLAKDWIESWLRSPAIILPVIAAASIGFGLLLLIADRRRTAPLALEAMSWRAALLIGLAQTFALVPGASRAGVTITAALLLRQDRRTAARFSFLLSIPAIVGAGLLLASDVVAAGDLAFGGDAVLAMVIAFAAAWAAMATLMRWLAHAGFTPFVVYRLLFGVALLGWAYLA